MNYYTEPLYGAVIRNVYVNVPPKKNGTHCEATLCLVALKRFPDSSVSYKQSNPGIMQNQCFFSKYMDLREEGQIWGVIKNKPGTSYLKQ